MRRLLVLLAATVLIAGGASAKVGAPRAVSLDFCADQLLIALADREQILAVSPVADKEFSYLREKTNGLKKVRPDAESIAPMRPDVVFRVWGGGPRLTTMLKRQGASVLDLSDVDDFDDAREAIRRAAALLDQEERGAAMIADLDRRLAALAERPLYPAPALYVTPGGVTAGKETMIDAIFTAARIRNAAAEAGLFYWPTLPAELIAYAPPGLIVAGFFESERERSNHWSAARHPVFKRLFEKADVIHLPADLLSCPAWYSIEAAERIAAGVDALKERHGN